ncbi:Uncharacterized protein YjbI, contains pentapeptide repeats [Sinosporangium album]|uniref:Uncharacterized protein YjbI, contains pentapeptide repeats n=1 Tax=Sinosporangium album TaxID=504805 RepID=A0A1G8HWL3_9ACTN|nr:pentapeptide repeat-containing protein [Sinosporangium album]SDI11059.1 Uncharacterized protein YjbI, contains pentapeptide repeats [Sinosporangium album]
MQNIRTVRRTHVTLPGLDDADLNEIGSLGESDLREFAYSGGRLRELSLSKVQLVEGRVTGLAAQRIHLDGLRLNSVVFSGCDLSGLCWTDSRLTRVVFTDCKLLGAAWEVVTLEDVIFERCKLDLAVFTRLRVAGPVVFSSCSLREATFTAADLSGGVTVDDCDLTLTEFDGGKYRDLDLRGNDLSALRGVSSLRHVVIDRSQTPQLAEALAAELEVVYGEDLKD